MPGTIRFHLDENVSSAIADGLRNRSVDFTTTIEEGLIASSDQAQLSLPFLKKDFTQDADFQASSSRC